MIEFDPSLAWMPIFMLFTVLAPVYYLVVLERDGEQTKIDDFENGELE